MEVEIGVWKQFGRIFYENNKILVKSSVIEAKCIHRKFLLLFS